MAPWEGMDAWMKLPQEERAADEKKMMDDWNAWTAAHNDMIKETIAAGKTKLVTKGATADHRNNLMMYSIVEAESHEAAAKAFEDHPHFTIPGATIEVMTMRPIP